MGDNMVWSPRVGATGDDRFAWPAGEKIVVGTPEGSFSDPPTLSEVEGATGINQIVAFCRYHLALLNNGLFIRRFGGMDQGDDTSVYYPPYADANTKLDVSWLDVLHEACENVRLATRMGSEDSSYPDPTASDKVADVLASLRGQLTNSWWRIFPKSRGTGGGPYGMEYTDANANQPSDPDGTFDGDANNVGIGTRTSSLNCLTGRMIARFEGVPSYSGISDRYYHFNQDLRRLDEQPDRLGVWKGSDTGNDIPWTEDAWALGTFLGWDALYSAGDSDTDIETYVSVSSVPTGDFNIIIATESEKDDLVLAASTDQFFRIDNPTSAIDEETHFFQFDIT